MTNPRRFMRFLLLACLATFPIFARAANTELRVLFDTDNNAGTGCTVSGMAGVDQVLVTKVSDDGTTANVTETYRQICAGGVLGGPVDVNTGGWGAGFQPASGKMLVETAIAFSAFGPGSPPPMRIGFSGTRGGSSFTVLAQTNGDPIVFPKPPAGRRRAVGHPGTDRVIILDGLDPDWAGLSPIAPGSSGGGASDLKLTQAFAFSNPNDSVLYFNYNLNTSGIEAVDDTYVRPQGEALTEPAPGVLGNDISNGLPLTAVPVGAPEHGDVTLNPDGSFTYTPDDPGSLEPDAFDYKATHGSDESNVATVNIFVEPFYQPPVFTSANSVQLQVGVPANFTVTTDGLPPPAITRTGALPTGVTFTDNGDGTATIGGTPANGSGGSYAIIFTATNAAGTVNQNFTIIVCNTIAVTNPATSTGTAGAAFSQTFTQTGAVGGATFTRISGTLPAGLTLATNGTLSGTPTVTGSFPIVVRATDSNGCTGDGATYNLVIGCQAITVTNPATSTGTAGAAFSQTFTQTGAIGSATFTTSSTLPTGITLATNGTLAGTPTQTGTFPIVVMVTDANGCTGTGATYTLVIGCQTITVTNPATNTGTGGVAFSQTFTQTGAIGGATFTTASTLPAGLTLATNGTLSGTPTQTGTFLIDVTVTDGNACIGTSATYNLTINCPTITVTNPLNTGGTVNAAFSETFTQTAAVGGATFTLNSGVLPAGLTLSTGGVLAGVPTEDGSFPITVLVTDGNGCTGVSATYNLVIACQTITVNNPSNATGPAGTPFSETFTQTGGILPVTFTTSSTLPTGLTLSTAGVLSGTPSQGGTFPITVLVTDANGCTGTSPVYTLIITCPTITVTNPANNQGTSGVAFSETFTQTGGVGTITWSVTGALPTGITLAPATGILSGTTTQAGVFPITITATDQNGCTGAGATYNLTINCQTIAVTNPGVNTGTVDAAFSETFTVTGILGTVTWSETGALPAGITLDSSTGVLSGTPTVNGVFPITVTATDTNGCFDDSSYTLTINCQTITVNIPGVNTGTVDASFSQFFSQTGAHGTATFSTLSALPPGLTLNSATGELSGTPTAPGVFPIDVTVTDDNSCTGTSATYTLTISCQTISVNIPGVNTGTTGTAFSQFFTQLGAHGTATFSTASTLPTGFTLNPSTGELSGTTNQHTNFSIVVVVTDSNSCTGTSATYNLTINCQTITVTNPANTSGTVNAAFSETFTQTGAIGGETFTLNSGVLPAGVTLSTSGLLAGMPTEDGSFPITVLVTDGNGCTGVSATYNLVINCQTITVTNPANATGPAGTPFSETFTQTGAILPATFTTGSTLPTGLSLSTAGVLSGTPTQGGTFPITVLVTDANGCTGTSPVYTLIITCPTITVTNPANNQGTSGVAFSETFTQVGGLGTITWSVTGALPVGITMNSATGELSGTTNDAGNFPITVTATDQNGCTGTGATYTLTINCQTITVTNPGVNTGTVDAMFSQTFTETGVLGTVTWSVESGTLPDGITLNSSSGLLSGTPTEDGSFLVTIRATDSNGCFDDSAYTLTINCQTITVTNPGVNTGTVDALFSQQFTETGAHATATFTTSSTLPAGLTLQADGTLTGTPTEDGVFNIDVLVTDANGCTGTNTTYTLTINCQTITVNNPGVNTGTVGTLFSQTFTQVGAHATATFTTSSTLPNGITLSTAGLLSGTPTQFGVFAIDVLVTDANGCTGTNTTYNLTINCQTITVNNPGVNTGTVSALFSQQFTETGALSGATFTTSSTLPAGLTLAADGTLSGTPTEDGVFNIVVVVTDGNGCTGTGSTYTLTINCQTITVTNPVVTTGTAGTLFSQMFTQTDAVGAVTFTTSSTLPAGLILQADGTLTGTPTEVGNFNIVVTVTDVNGCTGTGPTYNLTINCQTITVTNPATTSVQAGTTLGAAYTFTATGILGTANWTLETGPLPVGITLNATSGQLEGSSTVQGSYPITVRVTDTNGCFDISDTYTLDVVCPVITVARTGGGAFPAGTFNTAYTSESFAGSGGTAPYTFAVTGGTFPTGLTLNNDGTISGTPTQTGTFIFTVTATDASLCPGSQSFTIAINPFADPDSYSNIVNNTQAVVTGTTTAPATPHVVLSGLLIADDLPSGAVVAVAGTFATTQGGSVTIAADGSFLYTPPVTANALATDSFTYTISSNTGGTGTPTMANGTVTLNLAGRVWYVKNDVANGDGRSHSPFNSTSNFTNGARSGPDKPSDIIFVHRGDGTTNNLTSGVVLLDNEQLIGEGVALVVNTHTLVVAGLQPQLTNSGPGVVVELGNSNTVKGLTLTGGTNALSGTSKTGFTGDVLTLQNASGTGFSLTTFLGTATLTNSVIANNGIGLDVNGGTVTLTLNNTNSITANAGQRSVRLQTLGATANIGATITDNGLGIEVLTNAAAGVVNFTGTQTLSTTVNPAVFLNNNNVASTISFSGTLSITTTTGRGFRALGGGILNVTGVATIDAQSNGAGFAALQVTGMTIGGGGVTFGTVNGTNVTTGILVTNNTGTVTVTGGTISGSISGVGISLQGASANLAISNLTITGMGMGISNTTNFGTLTIGSNVTISGTSALSLTSCTVNGTFASVTSTGGFVSLTGVSGTWGTTAGSLTGNGVSAAFNVSGGSSNITWGGTISQANAANVVTIAGSNTGIINFNGNVSSTGASTGLLISNSSGTYNFNGATNTFSGVGGITIGPSESGNITFSNGSTITTTGTAFNVSGGGGAVTAAITYSGTINKASSGVLILVDNLDAPGTLTMTHAPAAAGNLSINHANSTGISVINSSSTNITIANASVTFQSSGPGFTSTNNTGGTVNLQGIALAGTGNQAGMLLAGGGTINVTSGAAAPSITMTGATNNAIDGTTTVFAGTLNLNNTAITGGGATAVRLGGGTLAGTGSTIAAGAQAALNLSGVALTNGAGLTSITSSGGTSGVILANVTGGTYTIAGGSLTGHTTAAWVHTNSGANAATISFSGPITPANNARAIDIGTAAASSGLRGGTITLSGAITTTSNAANANAGGVRVRNSTGGTLTLSNATQSFTSNANIAVELTTNPGTTFNFSGGSLTISSTTGKGFVGSGGGTINVTGVNNTISTTGNNAFEVVGTAGVHFGGGYEWRSITSTNGTKGISLQYHDGAFTVTGDGADGGTAPDSVTSGGTITGADQRGAEFVDVDGPVSLNGMTFTNSADTAGPDATVAAGTCGSVASGGSNTGCFAGIHFDTVSGVTVNLVNVTGSGQMGINGNAVNGLTMTTVNVTNAGTSAQEDGIRMYNMSGSGSMTSVVVSAPFAMGLNIENVSAVLGSVGSPFLITSSSFQNSSAAQGAVVHTDNTGVAHVKFVGGTISGHFSAGIQTANDGGTLGIYIDGTAFSNNAAAALVQGLSGTTNVDIRNITHVGRIGGVTHALVVNGHGNGTVTAEIINNQIGNGAVGSGANCGGGCRGISVDARITSSVVANIRGNTVRNVDESGIHLRGGEGSSRLTANITGNLIRDPDGGATFAGIFADSGVLSSDTNCVTAQIGGTTAWPGSPSSAAAEIQNRIEGAWATSGVRARKLFGAGAPPEPVFNLPLYDGSGVVNWITARNSFSGVATAVTQNAGSGGAFTGATSCP